VVVEKYLHKLFSASLYVNKAGETFSLKLKKNCLVPLPCHVYVMFNLILQLKKRVVTIDGYSDVPSNKEDLLLQAVAQQPVSVGICGSARAFQLYSQVQIHN